MLINKGLFHIVSKTNTIREMNTTTYTLADIHLRTGNFQKNVLSYYPGTTQDNEMNDTPFESHIK